MASQPRHNPSGSFSTSRGKGNQEPRGHSSPSARPFQSQLRDVDELSGEMSNVRIRSQPGGPRVRDGSPSSNSSQEQGAPIETRRLPSHTKHVNNMPSFEFSHGQNRLQSMQSQQALNRGNRVQSQDPAMSRQVLLLRILKYHH